MAIQIIREVTADVVRRSSAKGIYAKQNDMNSRFLNIRIQEDGKNIVVESDVTVLLNVERPDRASNIFYGEVNPDGTVKVPLTSWMLELVGTLVCDVSIVYQDVAAMKLSTMQFNIYVEAAVITDEHIEDTEEYSVIVDLLSRAEAADKLTSDNVERAMAAAEAATAVCSAAMESIEASKADGTWRGPKGADGVDGYTPKREVDYWTPADKAEIKQYVEDAILNGEW